MSMIWIAVTSFVIGLSLGASGLLKWLKAKLPWTP